ncbi:MAG: Flp pilus assembly complex ATPase component [Gammaproteobacteria bacterium]|nr:Flp pilus assembly complex ATPase component [Gammaproteobacteria bacterium]
MGAANKIRIGDLLVASGDISPDQLDEALAEQKHTGLKLGRILVEKGFVDEDRLLGFLSEQLGVPFVDLTNFEYDEALVAKLPETYARRYRAVVLEENDGELLVGMADPIDIFAFDELARQLNQAMNVAVVREAELLALLDSAYRRTSEIVSFASELDGELSVDEFNLGSFDQDEEDQTPVARLLQSILEDAVQIRASDVHIEPGEKVLRLRFRVDGVLQEQILNERRIAPALVSRLKLMAGLDISEKRLPQDGRFEARLKNKDMDVRLSTLPTTHGESVVMRLADHSSGNARLDEIGMDDVILQRFRRMIKRPNGLILVTGPTGSGKTTTLYGALNELNTLEKKIITVEDPVEFQLERINQVQVMPKIGLNFAKVLRSTLRQDPDILLVGEVRDSETADIALRAAMTGHLVLSTLHTNDAISSALRLLDIGVEGYIVASSVRAIVAQRLVRRICEGCTADYTADEHQMAWLSATSPDVDWSAVKFTVGEGCNKCNRTGYYGRIGVFELLEIDADLADALRADDTALFSKQAQQQAGFESLVHCALRHAQNGTTSLDEVIALSGHEEELWGHPSPAQQSAAEPKANLEQTLVAAQQHLEDTPPRSNPSH